MRVGSSMVEQRPFKALVLGSSPSRPTPPEPLALGFSGTMPEGDFALEIRIGRGNGLHLMKLIPLLLTASSLIALAGCNEKQAAVEQPTFQCVAAKLTIADKQVDSVVQWNTKTGEARLIQAASLADKSTGQQANLIGWVQLVDLQQQIQSAVQQIQAQQAAKAPASPSSTPIPPQQQRSFPTSREGSRIAPAAFFFVAQDASVVVWV
jgi:hypothetical protein